MTNPLTRHLNITICTDAADAIAQGFDYTSQPAVYKPIEVLQVVIVQNGTVEKNQTFDFILEAEGQKYVFLLTGKLLRMLAAIDADTGKVAP
jgi:hypothetical protein